MTNINQKFEQLNSLSENEILKQASTDSLKLVLQYLGSDLENPECKFSKNEDSFTKKIKCIVSNQPNGLKKYFPFLVSKTEKINCELLKEIDSLVDKKKGVIKTIYQKDISIVEEFLRYTKQKLKTGEIFYYEKDYEKYGWTKTDFPNKMYSYLAYQIRVNPDCLTTNYVVNMKGHFAFIGLGLMDQSKVKKANHYFTKTKNPLSFKIPETYNDVSSEILMSVAVMSENENLLGRIADDVIKKYG